MKARSARRGIVAVGLGLSLVLGQAACGLVRGGNEGADAVAGAGSSVVDASPGSAVGPPPAAHGGSSGVAASSAGPNAAEGQGAPGGAGTAASSPPQPEEKTSESLGGQASGGQSPDGEAAPPGGNSGVSPGDLSAPGAPSSADPAGTWEDFAAQGQELGVSCRVLETVEAGTELVPGHAAHGAVHTAKCEAKGLPERALGAVFFTDPRDADVGVHDLLERLGDSAVLVGRGQWVYVISQGKDPGGALQKRLEKATGAQALGSG